MTNVEEILQRGNCFKLLAACFYEPDKEMFLAEQVCTHLASQLMPLSPAVTSAEAMNTSLEKTAQEQLMIDYAALFVGPFELIAAPYGSVYLEKNRRVMGDSTIAAQRYYEAEGLSIEMKEPPDHIAIELEFMYYLCSKEVTAISEGDEAEAARLRELQSSFFQNAIGWIPEFSELIGNGAATQYYKSLASCLTAFYSSCRNVYQKTSAN